jgi:uncharacterized protein
MTKLVVSINLITVFVLLLISASAPCHAAQQQGPEGSWTGGFFLAEKWEAVLVRLNSENGKLGGTADMISPFYGESETVMNQRLDNLKWTSEGLHFEILVGARRAVFDGQQIGDTISGNYVYDNSKGTFGLTRRARIPLESLQKYYGAYRVSDDRVISILRSWTFGGTLWYVDYKTGRVGTLWPSSETEFFAGDGYGVSFPITVRISFKLDSNKNVEGLIWQRENEPNLAARRVEFKEERITFTNGDIKFGGTLLSPPAQQPHAVAIVTPGDYGTSRDQLRIWAHNYVSRGIAAFIFDSRGAGESGGNIGGNSWNDLANDVLSAVKALKTRDDVDPKQIGLFGFSNSAFIISLAASRSNDVSFLILQSPALVPPWKQESFRAETQLRVDEFPESEVKRGADFMRLKWEAARTGEGWEKIEKILENSRNERWLAYTNPPRSIERLKQVYQATMTYDPTPAYEGIHIPVFAYWGGKDTYVPVPESISAFKRAMAKAGNDQYVIKIYPRASHGMIESETGGPSTGGTGKTYPPDFWRMQGDWLLNLIRARRR